jgi:hypothetical protein
MNIAITFTKFFVGALVLAGVAGLGGQGLFRLGKWIEKRGGNSMLAWFVPYMITTAILFAACGTWIAVRAGK